MHRRIKKVFIIADVILLLILIAFVVVFTLTQNDDLATPQNANSSHSSRPLVYLNGRSYQEKSTVTNILLLGIDSTGEMKSSGTVANGAKCDFVSLLTLDTATDSYSLVHFNRDTMTEVPRIGIGGVAGTSTMQLALAYTYGDGMKESCKNTVEVVEYLLYGAKIDHYFAINMSGLERLIDSIGGVDITVHGDFSAVTDKLIDGQLTHLDGALCMTYLRARKDVGEQTNIERSMRQREFINELLPQLEEHDDLSINLTKVANYVVTDMNASMLSATANRLSNADFAELVTPDGEISESGEFIEFYADDASLRELVIRMFYEPTEVEAK